MVKYSMSFHQFNSADGDFQQCLKEVLGSLGTLGSTEHQFLQSGHSQEGSILKQEWGGGEN